MRTAKKNSAGVGQYAILAVVGLGLITGCGVTVEGGPSAEGQTPADEERFVEWNPCSALPEEAVKATGADPASKEVSADAPGDQARFRICSWDAVDGPYHIGVGTTTFTQDQWNENTAITGIGATQVNDRPALTFQPDNGDDPVRQCFVSMPMKDGSVFVDVNWQYSQRDSLPESPPCKLAIQHAEKLEPYLPR